MRRIGVISDTHGWLRPEAVEFLRGADFLAVFPLKGAGRLRLIGPVSWDPDREHREPTFDDIDERAIGNLKLTVARVNWRGACPRATGAQPIRITSTTPRLKPWKR